jgi:hypothetical protein
MSEEAVKIIGMMETAVKLRSNPAEALHNLAVIHEVDPAFSAVSRARCHSPHLRRLYHSTASAGSR